MVALAARAADRLRRCEAALPGRPHPACRHRDGLGGVAGHAHRFAPADEPGYLGPAAHGPEVSAVTAACLVIRRDVFEQVGGFDESLTVAFNDVDFASRCAPPAIAICGRPLRR